MVENFMVEKFMVEKFRVEKFMIEKFMVEKFMVEKFMVENSGVKMSCNPFQVLQKQPVIMPWKLIVRLLTWLMKLLSNA